ncbi:MAG: ATP-binding protein [Elusimicrobiota bacterium]
MIKSVRFRITLWYSVTLFIILSLFSFYLYSKLKTSLYDSVDDMLFLKAESVRDSILNFIEEYPLSSSCADFFNCDKRFADFVSHIINSDIKDPNLNLISLSILNKDGNYILRSVNSPEIDFVLKDSLNDLIKGVSVFDGLSVKQKDEEIIYRIYSAPVRIYDKTYIIQAIRTMSTINLALKTTLRNIIIAIPLTVLFTAFLGMLMVKMTLNPINNITRTAKQITDENLHLRIPLPKNRDEIWDVANFLNEMLDRIEKYFLNQKTFIQDLAHQLKTPITVIKGEIDVALKKERTEMEYKEIIKSVYEEINRISELIENLIVLARFSNLENKYSSAKKADLLNAVKKSMDLVKKYAELKSVKLNLIVDGISENFYVKADEFGLIKAISNIMENAVKYSYKDKNVFVRLYKEDSFFCVEIKDEGIGISKEDIGRIFERFYRGENSSNNEGFGLGLSIAKAAVENIGGKITIESEPNKGSAFKITIPKKD